ncbi:hypothetical protein GALL_475870 [mine drainage metagenome]|uniref:Thioredoxin n=1 Tax=mine drainage metagenome TaxID=410659 RepID=A0A1J5PH70_9ZZZZ
MQGEPAQLQFLWIDVEDQADLLEPIDVDDFPTLLLASGDQARFFGPLTPQAETLVRLIRTQAMPPGAPALQQPGLTELVARVRAAHPSGF